MCSCTQLCATPIKIATCFLVTPAGKIPIRPGRNPASSGSALQRHARLSNGLTATAFVFAPCLPPSPPCLAIPLPLSRRARPWTTYRRRLSRRWGVADRAWSSTTALKSCGESLAGKKLVLICSYSYYTAIYSIPCDKSYPAVGCSFLVLGAPELQGGCCWCLC